MRGGRGGGAAVGLAGQVDAGGAVQLLQLAVAALLLHHPAGGAGEAGWAGAARAGAREQQPLGARARHLWVPPRPTSTHPQTRKHTRRMPGAQKVLGKRLVRKTEPKAVSGDPAVPPEPRATSLSSQPHP